MPSKNQDGGPDHHENRVRPNFGCQGCPLSQAYAMFSRTSALHFKGPPNHVAHGQLSMSCLLRIILSECDILVEIAIAHMTLDRHFESERLALLLTDFNNLGQATERHRYISSPWYKQLVSGSEKTVIINGDLVLVVDRWLTYGFPFLSHG